MTTRGVLGMVAAFLVIFAVLGALFWALLESLGEPYQAQLPAAPFTAVPVQYRIEQGGQWSDWQGMPGREGCPFNLRAERLELRLRPGLEGIPLEVLNSDNHFGPWTNREVRVNRRTDRIVVTGRGRVTVWARTASTSSPDALYYLCRVVLQK